MNLDIYDDMGDRETVMIPKKEFVREHKRLIGELRHGDREQLNREAKRQAKELAKEERKKRAREAGKAVAKELGGFAVGAGTTALATPYLGPVGAGVLGGALKAGFHKLVG